MKLGEKIATPIALKRFIAGEYCAVSLSRGETTAYRMSAESNFEFWDHAHGRWGPSMATISTIEDGAYDWHQLEKNDAPK